MSLRRLAVAFHAGLVPSVAILLSGSSSWIRFLLPAGIVHVLLLWALGRRLKVPFDRHAIASLHKAGFLHTLLGLGGAVVVLAGRVGDSGPNGEQVTLALAPIGAALVPHILGVWLGHVMDLKRGGAEPDDRRKLEETADAVLLALERVQAAASDFSGRVEGSLRAGGETARTVTEAVARLTGVMHESAEAATRLRRTVDDVTTATGQIHTVHAQLVELMHSALLAKRREGGSR